MSVTRAAQPGSARFGAAAPVSPLGRLGSWSYRHRRLVAIAWVLVLMVVSLAGRLAGSQFKDNLNGGTSTPSQQAAEAADRLASLPFIEHDLVTFEYIELDDNSPA